MLGHRAFSYRPLTSQELARYGAAVSKLGAPAPFIPQDVTTGVRKNCSEVSIHSPLQTAHLRMHTCATLSIRFQGTMGWKDKGHQQRTHFGRPEPNGLCSSRSSAGHWPLFPMSDFAQESAASELHEVKWKYSAGGCSK